MVNVKKQRERAKQSREQKILNDMLDHVEKNGMPLPEDGKYLCPLCDEWSLEVDEVTDDDVSLICSSCGNMMGMSRNFWDDPQKRIMMLAESTKFRFMD